MPSIWQNDCEMPEFPQLSGNAEADVLIIGGGLAGILAAYFLKSEGLDCIICEGGRICGGEKRRKRGGNHAVFGQQKPFRTAPLSERRRAAGGRAGYL